MAKPKSYINLSYEAMAGYGAPAQEKRRIISSVTSPKFTSMRNSHLFGESHYTIF